MSIKTKYLEELQEKYGELVNKYLAAYNGKTTKSKDLKELKKSAQQAISKYNEELAKEQYRVWDAEGDAVKTAIRLRFVPNCVKVSYKVDEETDVMTATFSNISMKASLPMMEATIGADKFSEENWFAKCEKLAWIIAGRLNERLGENPNFVYHIKDASRVFQFPDDVNPYTDKGVLVALQQVFDAVLMVPDKDGKNVIKVAKAKDQSGTYAPQWEYIKEAMTAQGNEVGKLIIGGTGKMSELVADAMHITLTNGNFHLEEV